MSIKTPVTVTRTDSLSPMLVDADKRIIAEVLCSELADTIAHALNTHAALRASHAEMVKALTKITATQDCGCRPCRGQCDSHAALKVWIEEAQDLARTALSNAAKVEVVQ